LEFGYVQLYTGQSVYVTLPTYLNNAIIICNGIITDSAKYDRLSCINVTPQRIEIDNKKIETIIFAPDPTVIPFSTDISTYKNIDQYTFQRDDGTGYIYTPPHSKMANVLDELYINYTSGFYVTDPAIDLSEFSIDKDINEAGYSKFWLAIGNFPKSKQKLIYNYSYAFDNPNKMVRDGHWIAQPYCPDDLVNYWETHRLATDEEYNILPDWNIMHLKIKR